MASQDNNLDKDLEEFRNKWLQEVKLKKQHSEDSNEGEGNADQVGSSKMLNEGIKKGEGSYYSEINNLKQVSGEELIDSDLLKDWTKLSVTERHGLGLKVYKEAIIMEKQGKLGEALNYYRKAFKIDPDVDLSYRTYYQSLSTKEKERMDGNQISPFSGATEDFEFIKKIHMTSDYVSSTQMTKENSKSKIDWKKLDPMYHEIKNILKNAKKKEGVEGLVENTDRLTLTQEKQGNKDNEHRPILFKPADPTVEHCLSTLPDPILTKILGMAMSKDLHSIGSFSSTCIKGLFLSRDKYLWYEYSKKLYNPNTQLYIDFMKNELIPVEQYVQQHFKNQWRFFLIEYPRIRFDGIYISTCYYIRQGISESSFNRPIHMVTYYRYLRFFPDGTCIKRLTTDEPSQVVPNMKKESCYEDLFYGNFQLTKQGIDAQVTGRHRPNMEFMLNLELKSTSRGKHNKLNWIEYSSLFYSDLTTYSLKQFKPFYFSKVRSYPST
ncbi:hypothetical protein K502DRAFT_341949 [Neoconidiobolus thromboides FSU 785]|nr:hypothetical protein K502DRAFT_341949 [Neoconidiobolus thromboides FSU 785]